MKRKTVTVLPGDGIGHEVCHAALPIIEKMNLPINLQYGKIGWECWKQEGNPIPDDTWKKIKNSDAVLLGAITSKGKKDAEEALPESLKKLGHEYISPVIQLRQKLGLYTNIRPAYYITGSRKPFNICVIRENTEGLYSGLDFKGIPTRHSDWLTHPNIDYYGQSETAWTVRLQTRYGLERIFKQAFEYAKAHNMSRVTFADKPNVMRESGQFVKDIFFNIANQYAGIKADIHNVDAVALWLVKKPHEFGVIVAENMFGDILSDLAAGVMGGLGFAPSANIGSNIAYFEPVHGSAPKMAGKNKGNPSAMFLSIGLMLEYLGFIAEAEKIKDAVKYVTRSGINTSYDCGGNKSTQEVSKAIIDAAMKKNNFNDAIVITIGDELLDGKYVNTNLSDISHHLRQKGYKVKTHLTCLDNEHMISEALIRFIGDTRLIVISGGLGPTSDDKTRFAISKALETNLIYDEPTWERIKNRLTGFGVPIDPSNRVQAYFPNGSTILPNEDGTASGFSLNIENTKIIILPGPPREAMLMLTKALPQTTQKIEEESIYIWHLLGTSEGEVGSYFDKALSGIESETHFLWKYPYIIVEVKTKCLTSEKLTSINSDLKSYIVSQNGKKASDLLIESSHKVNWCCADSQTQDILQLPSDRNKRSKKKNIYIDLTPPLNDILKNSHYTGIAHLKCRSEDGTSESIQFPCRGPEIVEFIKEYSSWFALKTKAI
ncbi:MAG: isocitrate/isopropylmalate dehydrogenase family protein [Endozoicomonas sp. (ex Botrylloides leachii)]|nr:isocitrate/isopropylmalate dehydrogenase family protein [Endozoicomonas sp. (ex Botrylloides leachii)]